MARKNAWMPGGMRVPCVWVLSALCLFAGPAMSAKTAGGSKEDAPKTEKVEVLKLQDDSKATLKETVDWLGKTFAGKGFMYPGKDGGYSPVEMEYRDDPMEMLLYWINAGPSTEGSSYMFLGEMPLRSVDTSRMDIASTSYGLILRLHERSEGFRILIGSFYGHTPKIDRYGSDVSADNVDSVEIAIPDRKMGLRVARAILHAARLVQEKPEPF